MSPMVAKDAVTPPVVEWHGHERPALRQRGGEPGILGEGAGGETGELFREVDAAGVLQPVDHVQEVRMQRERGPGEVEGKGLPAAIRALEGGADFPLMLLAAGGAEGLLEGGKIFGAGFAERAACVQGGPAAVALTGINEVADLLPEAAACAAGGAGVIDEVLWPLG